MTTLTVTNEPEVDKSKIWKVGLAAVALSVVANLVAYFILRAILELPSVTDFPPFSPGAIGFLTAVYTFIAVIVFAIVARVAKRPIRTYRIIATIAFVLSILPNMGGAMNPAAFPFPGATATAFFSLIVFHVIAFVIVVWFLTTKTLEG